MEVVPAIDSIFIRARNIKTEHFRSGCNTSKNMVLDRSKASDPQTGPKNPPLQNRERAIRSGMVFVGMVALTFVVCGLTVGLIYTLQPSRGYRDNSGKGEYGNVIGIDLGNVSYRLQSDSPSSPH